MNQSRILLGTSGFSYDDWRGVFYPADIQRRDMLDFYARAFNALEINATYYTTPGRQSAESMVRRANGRLAFAVKAPGALTHKGDTSESVVLPWRRFLEPFREGDCLAAVLLQFPARLHATPDAWQLIERIHNQLGDLPIVVELRHASWDNEAANRRLDDLRLSRAMVDQPGDVRGLSASGALPSTGPITYTRFHGRNAADWYANDDRNARYRYRYTAKQLAPWAQTLKDARPRAESTLAFFNNHPDGNAVLDAQAFSALLGQPVTLPDRGELFG